MQADPYIIRKLKRVLAEEWRCIPQNDIKHIVESKRRRIPALIFGKESVSTFNNSLINNPFNSTINLILNLI